MNDPRKQRFAPYVRDLADRMRLKDWSIDIVETPSDDGAEASVWFSDYYRQANVRLSEDFLDGEPEVQRATLVHELLHCLIQRVDVLVTNETEGSLKRAIKRDLEYTVEELAQVIAPHMPLPPDDGDDSGEV